MRWMMLNSKGCPDAMLTFSVVAFGTVILKVLIGGVTFDLMGKTIGLGSIDGSTIGAMLAPTLGAYVMRRHTDSKLPLDDSDDASPSDPTEK